MSVSLYNASSQFPIPPNLIDVQTVLSPIKVYFSILSKSNKGNTFLLRIRSKTKEKKRWKCSATRHLQYWLNVKRLQILHIIFKANRSVWQAVAQCSKKTMSSDRFTTQYFETWLKRNRLVNILSRCDIRFGRSIFSFHRTICH